MICGLLSLLVLLLSIERNITVNIPNAAVEGSERVYLTGTADVVGPAMNNLMQLIRYTFLPSLYSSYA